ncbi:beta-defensin 13-like [Rhineura floridana]|uniref:beta-defensin 13-like n=1 Tax=Rhineura floridana TaxID=261503 RepID=UPI002AC819D5|nr:beta-defensin 13-like [Rhineura floridana]
MRVLFLLWVLLLFLYQSAPATGDLYDSLQCYNNRGHCRRLCFYNEGQIGTCTNRRQRCCK